jgi:nicotinate-nucleotide adenylyltransferase
MQEGSPRRLGVLGGTFDPLHVGHLAIARDAAAAFDLDRVLFVPTGQPWQKSHYSPAEDRFLMACLGAAGSTDFATSRIEIDRRGPTYTLDTMADLRRFHGEATELFFIAGADAVLKLGTWNGIDELGAFCEVIAVTRKGAELAGFERRAGWPRVHIHEIDPIDVSATDIRARVRAGERIDTLVPPPVARYIEERRLYTEEPESVDA